MKKLCLFFIIIFSLVCFADTKISQLPLGSANNVNINDSFPYVDSVAGQTKRLTLDDLVNLPAFAAQFAAMIPTQTGNSGKFLSTNGTNTVWSQAPIPYANAAALPVSAGDGAAAITVDTDTLWIFSTGTMTWNAVGGSSVPLSVGNVGSSPNAQAATLAANILVLQPASSGFPGVITTGVQSFAGNKTFTGTLGASNLSGTNTGDVSTAAFGSTPNADGLSVLGQALNLQPADATHPGGLTSADWNTFNGKQDAGNYITALTGDVTASGPGSSAATLATVNSNVGSFTNANITVNAKGLITAAANGSSGSVTAVSVASANGLAGSSSGGATPALTLSTTVTGLLQGNGTAISAATTGNLTDAGTDGITVTGGTGAVLGSGTSLAQHVSDSTHNGYLSSTDWSAFNGKGSGTVTSVAMTVPTFLSVAGSPVSTTGTLAVTLSGAALPTANGGTNVTSVTTAPTASAFAGWDANKNLSANNHLQGYATTATAAGTTTLTVGSTNLQFFTGTSTQTVTLPVTSTLVLGQQFLIANNSTGVVTVNSSGGNLVQSFGAGTSGLITCISTSGTGAASWSSALQSASIPNPTVTVLNSGTSQTYTPPSGVLYLEVEMVGGGGGGSGSGSTNGTAATDGGSTIFGNATCTGGTHSVNNGTAAGGAGGTCTGGAGLTTIVAMAGNAGQGNLSESVTTSNFPGGVGGAGPWGGATSAGINTGAAAPANSGAGGNGGGMSGTNNGVGGPGGGAGGFGKFLVTSPTATTYTIGSKGSGGGAGSGGAAGADAGSGKIIIHEYYQAVNAPTGTQSANTVYAGPTSGSAATASFRPLVSADIPTPGLTSTSAATYVALVSDRTIVETGSGKAITLLAGGHTGKLTSVVSETTGQTTLTPASGTVCGQSSIKLTGNTDSITLVDDGTNYVSTGTDCEVTHRIKITDNGSTCTISDSDGGSTTAWVSSCTHTSLTQQTLNIVSGVWSASPDCTFNYGPGSQNAYVQSLGTTNSSISLQEVGPSSGSVTVWAVCRGQR